MTAGTPTEVAAAVGPPSAGELRLRQTLVVALAVVSGATDAIGLLALGGAFTSVMTGNLVILGVAASTADGGLAASSGGAILAFCGGAALGARLAGTPRPEDRVWPRPVTRALTVELLFVTAYAVGWWISGASPERDVAFVLLLSTAVALGIQSSTVQRFGVSGLSTTYLTGTLTTVVIRLATGRAVREVWHSVEILIGLVAGAAAGAALVTQVPVLAPVLQLTALGCIVLAGAVLGRRR